MNSEIEIFVITNGRSTFPFVMKSIENQTIQCPVTVVRDMLWIDAVRKCAELSDSKFYLRVDDDMYLHSQCVAYYLSRLGKFSDAGVYECKLWEDWSRKPAGSLKAYSTKVVRKIGFRINKLGKIDKPFAKDLSKAGLARIRDSSMIGLHALSTEEDQKRYRSLWRDKNAVISKKEFQQTFDNKIHPCLLSPEQQYTTLAKLNKLNRRSKTLFAKFLEKT